MPNFNLKKQINKIYSYFILDCFSLAGAWVAILAARGFSLVEIGLAETIFHIASLSFEIPSGVLADVFGRKRIMIAGCIMHMIGCIIMIFSKGFAWICFSFIFQAISYNCASGSADALVYDSMKSVGEESKYDKFASNTMIIYRVFNGISTLCAGFALYIGYKAAYSVSVLTCLVQILILLTVAEIRCDEKTRVIEAGFFTTVRIRLIDTFTESIKFLKTSLRAVRLLFANSLIGAFDILLLFFLQAKLPEAGMPEMMLGFALFAMELGGVVGSRLTLRLKKMKYVLLFIGCLMVELFGVYVEHTGILWLMVAGGFATALADDCIQVRTNTILQDMFPSDQRATLISFESFTFSMIMIILSPLAGYFFARW